MVTALAKAPSLKGASSTIATKGADRAQNSHRDVSETTLTPAMLRSSTGNDDGKCDPPSAIAFLKPREHAGQVGDEKRGIDGHVEDGGNEREPGLLKSPEVAHGAAHPGVVAALVGQRARKLADHEGRRQAPEQRGEQQNQDGASVTGAVHDVFGAVGSARHHKEGGGDQGPKREANEFLPVGDDGEGLGSLELLPASCCQFLWLPPQTTHSHHRVSLEPSDEDILFAAPECAAISRAFRRS